MTRTEAGVPERCRFQPKSTFSAISALLVIRAEIFDLNGRAVIVVRAEVPFPKFLDEVLDSSGYSPFPYYLPLFYLGVCNPWG